MRGVPGEVLTTKSSKLEVLLRSNDLIVRKTALERGKGELKAQIDALKSFPPEIAAKYPRLLAHDVSFPPNWYEMPFYELRSMRDYVFHESTPVANLREGMQRLMRFLFESLYVWKTSAVPAGFVQRTYVNRMVARLSEVARQDQELATAIRADEVIYCGEVLLSPMRQVSKIIERIGYASLSPPRLCSIHGQLEFDHILVDITSHRHEDLILLDTSGIDSLSDTSYDLGKLMQSLRDKVDLIKEDQFNLSFDTQRPGRLAANLELANSRLEVSDQLCSFVLDEVGKYSISTRDPHLVMRAEFATAVHLCSALPYYYDPTAAGRRKAIAFYVQGAMEFHRFAERYLPKSPGAVLD